MCMCGELVEVGPTRKRLTAGSPRLSMSIGSTSWVSWGSRGTYQVGQIAEGQLLLDRWANAHACSSCARSLRSAMDGHGGDALRGHVIDLGGHPCPPNRPCAAESWTDMEHGLGGRFPCSRIRANSNLRVRNGRRLPSRDVSCASCPSCPSCLSSPVSFSSRGTLRCARGRKNTGGRSQG